MTGAMHEAQYMPDERARAAIAAALSDYNAERIGVHRRVRWRRPLFALVGLGIGGAIAALVALLAPGAEIGVFVFLAGLSAMLAYIGWHVGGAPARRLMQSARDRVLPVAFGFIDDVGYRHGETPAALSRLPRAAVGRFNRTTIGDVVSGRHDGMRFALFEAKLSRKVEKSTTRVFRGVVVHFALPAPYPGMLIAAKPAGALARFFRDLFDQSGLESVAGADARSGSAYEFRSDAPEAARPLVEGDFARALDWLRDAWPDSTARVALDGGDGFLLLPTERDFFEFPDISVKAEQRAHIEPLVAEMVTLLAIAGLVHKALRPA